MTIHQAQPVQRGCEIVVPLNRLKKSPRNARRTPHAAADVEALAASIAAKGVLQPPVVEAERNGDGQETGSYLVSIGEGRRLALRLLAKRRRLSKAEPIRCLLDDDNDPFEISLDENVTRFAMHPADQFEAFRELAQTKGWSAEEIAARFGVSATLVRQRLRLGAASPVLMAAYRAGELQLEQLMAFAISEDHARQEQVFRDLSYNRSPGYIRRMMTEHEVEASDRRARYVGVEAYEAAGGPVRRDLFSDDGQGWFEDAALLNRLALEKLAVEAEAVRQAEGWRWAEARLDYPHDHPCRRVYPRSVEIAPEVQSRLAALAEEYDAIVAACGEDDLPAAEGARLAKIDAELAAVPTVAYAPEVVAAGGLYAILGHDGAVRIERGFIRPEDEAEPNAGVGVDTEAAVAKEDDPPKPEPEAGPRPLSDRLVADLTAHRTAALRDALAGQPQVAFLAALHALALPTFYRAGATCLDLQVHSVHLGGYAEGLPESVASRAVEARHAAWAGRLPEEPEGLWAALDALDEADRLALFAHCVSLGVNAVRTPGSSSRVQAQADRLAERLDLDMGRYWSPTVASYCGRVTKAQLLEAVTEAVSPEAAGPLADLKKEPMAAKAAELLTEAGWLPALLRRPGAAPA